MNSIAAAKRRRAQPDNKPPTPIQQPVAQSPPPQRMTPQQYLAILESKIIALEKTVGASKPSLQIEVNTPEGTKQLEFSEYIADLDQKFMVLAEEISSLKDNMLKLQSFTMNVNEKLFERMQSSEPTIEQTVTMNTSSIIEPVVEESVLEEEPVVEDELVTEEEPVPEQLDDNELIMSSSKKKGKKKN